MKLITYPINPKNPAALIPVLLGLFWANKIEGCELIVFRDIHEIPKKIPGFDVETWIKGKYDPKFILTTHNSVNPVVLSFSRTIRISRIEGKWLRCPCGKVEIFSENNIKLFGYNKIKMIDEYNKCVACGEVVSILEGVGLIAECSLNNEAIKSILFPSIITKEIQSWLSKLPETPIMLTRSRDTGYKIKWESQEYYLDPTIYNLYVTWDYCQKHKDSYIVSGRDTVLFYSMCRLLFGFDVNHIFLPKINIENWNLFVNLNFEEAVLLLISSLNWKNNQAIVSFSDLQFIRRNLLLLVDKMEKLSINDVPEISKINRNFLNLRQ
ncbi:MAG: hypothetical protein HUU38_11690 [Anaerolineales bacterium]|nr:hypothetical protein [Anaerolineales bacterium]